MGSHLGCELCRCKLVGLIGCKFCGHKVVGLIGGELCRHKVMVGKGHLMVENTNIMYYSCMHSDEHR